jgi:hypothetical protein
VRPLLVGSAALALAASVTPQALLHGLLTQPVRKSELPAGVTKTEVSKRQPGTTSRHHHVAGEVEIVLGGPHGGRVVYVVFPTHADALANHAEGVRELKSVGGVRKVKKQLPGLPKPNLLVDASVNLIGITQVSLVTGNLEIAAQSVVPNAPSGSERDAIALAKFALRHLHAVESKLR